MRKTLSRENVIFAPIFTGFPSAPAVPFCFQPAHSSCFVCLVFLDLHPQGLWALQILCFEKKPRPMGRKLRSLHWLGSCFLV